MRRSALPLALLALSACAPQDAEITGSWKSWLAASSSNVVAERTRDQGDVADGEKSLNFSDTVTQTRFDCSPTNPLAQDQGRCVEVVADWHSWLGSDGFYILSSEIDAWRSEAILTSEGDFQLTFHMDLGDGEDFRVAWVVDPNFLPTVCTQAEGGAAAEELADGADWVEQWSTDEDGRHIFYLNAGAYQYNPYDSEEYWPLYQTWLSGYSNAKLSGEEFNSHPTDFGSGPADTWYLSLDPEAPDMDSYQAFADAVREAATTWASEMTSPVAQELGYGFDPYAFKVEDNMWRPVDASSAGLDGWISMDSSWVRLDKRGDEIEVGAEVSGDFQIVYDAIDSASRLVVQGSFTVPEIREDRWGYEPLYEEKQAENETPTCE